MERNPNDFGGQSADRENTGGSGGIGGTGGAGGYGNTGGTTGSAGYGTSGTGGYGAGSSTGATPSGLTEGSAPTNTGLAGTAPLADTYSSSADQGTLGDRGDMGAGRGRGLRDSAQERANQAREALGNAGHRARDMKQSLERTLADRLEQGASRLRSRGSETTAGAAPGSAAYAAAGTSAAGGAMAAEHGQNRQAEKLADGMDATAKWLREGDLKETIQEQARTNPGRTLLVALGVGYLLGKAIRRR
ncbi:MAG TPA: hypothetical protein VGE02_15985 [Gemmatimonadales bacterium]